MSDGPLARSATRAAAAAYFVCVGVGLVFLVLFGAVEQRTDIVKTNDFAGIWAGGRALVLGSGPYDPATWRAFVTSLGTQAPDTAVYGYPAWIALLFVPLALVPLEVASWAWTLATLALAILAVFALLRTFVPGLPLIHGVCGLALTMSDPAYHTFVLGQWGFGLVAATSAATIWSRDGRTWRAAASALAFLAKPQLFFAAPFGVFGSPRTVLRWLALGAAVAAIASAALPGWWTEWLAAVPQGRLRQPATLYALFAERAGPAGTIAAATVVIAAALVATRFALRTDGARATWLAFSLVMAPYEWAYDHILLLVPIVIASGVIAARSRRLGLIVPLVAMGILLFVSPSFYAIAIARQRETLSALIPLSVFILLVSAMWPLRRGVAQP